MSKDLTAKSQEFALWMAADQLEQTLIPLYGAIKATELDQPRLVLTALPKFEDALQNWLAQRKAYLDVTPSSRTA